MRQTALRGVPDVEEAMAEHDAVVMAYATGRVEEPVTALHRHLQNVRERSLRLEHEG
jgi:DNA-binding GntR family transcriptional regulator